MRVGLGERRSGQACGDEGGEVGAVEQALFVLTGQRVGDGDTRRLDSDDPGIELNQLALVKFPPVIRSIVARSDERRL